jgi:hypothetical protein
MASSRPGTVSFFIQEALPGGFGDDPTLMDVSAATQGGIRCPRGCLLGTRVLQAMCPTDTAMNVVHGCAGCGFRWLLGRGPRARVVVLEKGRLMPAPAPAPSGGVAESCRDPSSPSVPAAAPAVPLETVGGLRVRMVLSSGMAGTFRDRQPWVAAGIRFKVGGYFRGETLETLVDPAERATVLRGFVQPRFALDYMQQRLTEVLEVTLEAEKDIEVDLEIEEVI